FEKSKYADGSYFEKYLDKSFAPKLDAVKELFNDIFIPQPEDWSKLKDNVMRDGIYNAYRMAVAPTGSISYINNTSASLQPITRLVEER
ncbi:ribonucleotide-diphosphate reductase subunit alpha, partial [Vibrio vulnificus]